MEQLSGAKALALGALKAGVSLVTSYPGSPATAVVNHLIDFTSPEQVRVEWTGNEKVALETAYGACLVGTVHVGTLSYFAAGLSGACCEYPIAANSLTGVLVHVNCDPVADPNITPLSNTINGDASCPCGVVPTENATWGAVKSLYK